MNAAAPNFDESPPPSAGRVVVLALLGAVSFAFATESVIETHRLFVTIASESARRSVIETIGEFEGIGTEAAADVSFWWLLCGALSLLVVTNVVGAALVAWRYGSPFRGTLLWLTGQTAWWLLLPGAWELSRIASSVLPTGESVATLLDALPNLVFAVALAGWGATWLCRVFVPQPEREDSPLRGLPRRVWIGVAAYVVVFTTLNWRLYDNLLVPHGDSAMYEEHLWNVWHGKGFRSYLDRGLFLGEHVQVIHLLLLPVHVLWPSLKPMEFSESLALASGAIPVFWIARRHTGSMRTAALLSCAYLFYAPMQMLDIAIDLKTFRPIAFGVPAMLFGLDQMERRRFGAMLALFAVALAAKEDFAIVLAPLGVWLAAHDWRRSGSPAPPENPDFDETAPSRTGVWLGLGLAIFSTLYLLAVVKFVIPWFRGGVEVHYVGYFSRFGKSLGEVATNLLTNPGLLFSALAVPSTMLYVVAILVPLGLLPLLSPGRLAAGLPLFVLLCLNELSAAPVHHFHAPLVPIVLWAAAAGLGRFESPYRRRFAATFALACAVLTGTTLGLHPLTIPFWDAGPYHWRSLYAPSDRAAAFSGIAEAIPPNARVFSTDFVHPRFTHHRRSYDFSAYPRPSDAELTTPIAGESYWLVVDTRHRYSELHTPAEVLASAKIGDPANWQLDEALSNEWFLVFERR